ncbi:unnamed protein product [Closterium sp. NIES-54]
MAAQELRWLTYLLTDLGEAPRSPPVLYVDNKAMLALCQEHRLEQRTKHIALRYFLARELQQRGQLRLAYVASQANTADVFTKALQPCDHQRFCTVLGLVVFTVLFVLLYITLHVSWPCGHLLVLRLCGDLVIHLELALLFLTGLVTPCSSPLYLWGFPTCSQLLSSSFIPFTILTLGVPSSTSLSPPLLCLPPDQSQLLLQPASLLPAPSPYTEQSGRLTERREPASRAVSHNRTARRIPRSRPPPVPGTHAMALRPSSVPQRVPLPAPPDSSLSAIPDPESDHTRAASPAVSRLLATAVIDPSFEITAASALVAELLDFAAACRLDYATALVAESASASPPSVGGECDLGTDVLDRQDDFECLAAALPRFASMLLAREEDLDAPDIPTPRSYAEAIMGPYSSQFQAAMDAEMASWKSTGTYVDALPLSRENIVDGMWIFRVKRPLGYPPAFKARYVARGFSQRQGVDYFQTFSPTPKMTTLWVLLHVVAQRDCELHSLDFSTAFLQGSLYEEI